MKTFLKSTDILSKLEAPSCPWTLEKMMELKIISDVQLSPDNKSVVFTASEAIISEEKSCNLTRIYRARVGETGGALPFSNEKASSSQARWSPDGRWIAFLSEREGVKNLYLISAEGGEARQITDGKKDVQTFSWSPCGRSIAFVRNDEKEVEKLRKKTSAAYLYREESTVNRLFVLDPFSPSERPLTSDDYCVRGSGDFGTINVEFDWSPGGETIVFSYSPSLSLDDFYLDSSLAEVDVSTGCIISWEKNAPFESMPRYSPDGSCVAYLSGDAQCRYAINRRVALRSRDGKFVRLLGLTFNEGPLLMGANLLGWTADSKSMLIFEPKGTKFSIACLSVDGSSPSELATGFCFFTDPVLSFDKTMLSFVVQSPTTPPEAHVALLEYFAPVRVSDLNRHLRSCAQSKTESVSWQSSDGVKVEGLLTYPVGYEQGQKYPLLLVIHGGPMGFFNETFLGTPNPYPLALFAQEGFAILRPNPRGSCGYGKEFRCANYGDWGGRDFQDILTGVDYLIAKGIADPEKMGVMGWSYGGFMTAWAITQTARFKAASMGAGLCNLTSMAGTTDLYRFMTDFFGDLSKNEEIYAARSPLHHVLKVQTPLMIQHGIDDKRVPVSQAYEFYHALDRAGRRPILALYPGMGHRITDPKMLTDAMKRNLDWFQQFLK